MNSKTLLYGVLFFFSVSALSAQSLPSPKDYFGHQMGEEGKIIDYHEGLKYYQKLAEQSKKIQYTEMGKTTDGNPHVLLIISSEKNMAKIDEIKQKRARLNDPANITDDEAAQLANELPAVVFHTSSIHTTEISTAQVVPELVYTLLSDKSEMNQSILDNTVILIAPSANPDGQVKIKKWYEEQKGTSWEGRMPWLYHTYIGHDNNRDWVLLHFPEHRLVAQKVFLDWHPIYSIEMHQMGATGARIFVPPYQDPYDENTAPETVETMGIVGMAMSHRLTSEGKAGVVKNAIFDLYTPARAFQTYRGIARVLTETASANFASKRTIKPAELRSEGGGTGYYHPLKKSWNFPMPWKGGDWTFRTMVEYQLSANFAALTLVSGNPSGFNMSQYQALKRPLKTENWPYAFVFPANQKDRSSMARLLQAMQRGKIDIEKANSPFMADGRQFDAGSYIIKLNQRYGAWAKSLLEIQNYPDLRRNPDDDPIVPYDVTASTLPLMMGVDAFQIESPFKVEASTVTEKVFFEGKIAKKGTNGYVILPNSNEAYAVADALLDQGYRVAQFHESKGAFPKGSFFVNAERGLDQKMEELAKKWHFEAVGINDRMDYSAFTRRLRNPRIGIVEPWGGVMDAGWLRFMLEQWELEPVTIRNEDIKAGNLNDKYDIIIFPFGINTNRVLSDHNFLPEPYNQGIGTEGVGHLHAFVKNGGTINAYGPSSMTVVEIMGLPIENYVAEMDQKDYFAPGSLVLTELDQSSPLSYGLEERIAVMNRIGPVFLPKATVGNSPEMAGIYPNYDARLSGFLLGEKHLQGKGSIAVQKEGKGRIILYSMAPQFRAMTHGSYKLVFNAIFWAAREN